MKNAWKKSCEQRLIISMVTPQKLIDKELDLS